MTIRFELGHDPDLWILKVWCDLDIWPHTWPWPWIFMVKFWNSCIPEWEGRLTLHKEGVSRSFMTMTLTIWWPMLGAWIYQLVNGVTSVVGVPSTHVIHLYNNLSLSWYKGVQLFFPLKSVARKSFPAFPAHAQSAMFRIWQEAHKNNGEVVCRIWNFL